MTEITSPTTAYQQQELQKQLELLNAKYNQYFGNRTHPFTGEGDNIHNYYRVFTAADGTIQLHLKDGLPLEIGKDCMLVFNAIYK